MLQDYYQQECKRRHLVADPEQIRILSQFQSVHTALISENKKRQNPFLFLRHPHIVQGIYLWGNVGVGKTFLMDCFYQSLPIQKKLRVHFHQFMQRIHLELVRCQGKKNPLQWIAKELATKTHVLCFDEFFVSDITDAMLLGKLFAALFEKGVCLVLTSNIAPDDLYRNGLQREQFLPAIALIKKYTNVIHFPSSIDYRLRHLQKAGIFYTPLNDETTQQMEKSFALLTKGQPVNDEPISILGRFIPVKKKSSEVVWIEFSDLCHVPRSQKDYLEIATLFRTVFVSHIPVIDSHDKDTICLFISLVDVLYDAQVKLVISAAESIPQLYSRGYMILEYTRTHSRLVEMQSEDYFNSVHAGTNGK